MKIDFDNTYAQLPDRFFRRCDPIPVSSPDTIRVNDQLATRLGFDPDWLRSEAGAEFATGNRILDGSDPIAMAYAGHQFGNFVSQLGDGRALLLGEVVDDAGERFDIQLKGSGRTPFSRRGDGRAPLGPVLREYLVSEAMHALDIPTTRSLVAASTGDGVRRQSIEPGGVLVRVAHSHVRVGTFQYFAARDDFDAIRTLTEYVVERHFPDIEPGAPVDLLRAVADRQAELIARWMQVGFIHGVMNTDNMLICGETVDYGPCAFMNTYDPSTVYSSIDQRGRYAFQNQPAIAHWNLTRLANALLAEFDDDASEIAAAQEVLDDFPDRFRTAYGSGMADKLGLGEFDDDDWELVTDLLEVMYESEVDHTLTFRRLTELVSPETNPDRTVGEFFELPDAFEPWLEAWQERIDARQADRTQIAESMRATNPVVIARNHVVEAALEDAVQRSDLDAFHTLADVLAAPFDFPESHEEWVRPPAPDEEIAATFCGT